MSDNLKMARSDGADRIAALEAEIARLTAERDRFEAALGRACLVGGTTYLLERAEKAEAERDAAILAVEMSEAAAFSAGYEAAADARQADLAKAAITALHDIDDLVANSEGVSGLHLNGDIAPWSEIMDGGAHGAWLQSVERLREAIVAITTADARRIGGGE